MSNGYEVVDEGHVGGREQVESEWKTIRAVFHNFAELPSERGEETSSPVLECHGMKWTIEIYPGGGTSSSENEVFLSVFVNCVSSSDTNVIKARTKIRIPSAKERLGGWNVHDHRDEGFGYENFALRSDAIDLAGGYLVHGNLTIEIDIQVMLDKPPTWKPTNTVCSDMLKLLDKADADNSDVVFEIGEKAKGTGAVKKRGKKKSHPHSFYAHRNILSIRCPTLEALAEDCSPGSPIPIEDVEPEMFRMILRFIYGGEVPSTDILKNEGRSIIRAADEYGCTGLKLAAETELASDGISTENAAELILFADGTNCAMLKEAAMDYFVMNAQDVMSSEGFEQVKESPAVMAELMAAMAGGSKKRPASSIDTDERDYKRMRVATLRQKLDEKKLDVDGSKEMLVSRLQAADAESQAAAHAESENGEDSSENEDSDDDDA